MRFVDRLLDRAADAATSLQDRLQDWLVGQNLQTVLVVGAVVLIVLVVRGFKPRSLR